MPHSQPPFETFSPPEGSVLDRRALNRALLARQWLLQRQPATVIEALTQLVGMQSQAPEPPYVGLWSRLVAFRPGDLAQLIIGRQAVRLALMRSTLHLVTAEDALALRPVVQPVLERALKGTYGRRLEGVDVDALAATARALLDERPMSFSDLRERLALDWPAHDPVALSSVARTLLPLVQLPPRGVWGEGGASVHTTAEAWLGRPLGSDMSADDMILRYLAAFGPATIKDIQAWSGLTGLRAEVMRLRPGLRTFRDESGKELLDVPDGVLPHPDTPAPPRLVADFDNLLLSHADRTRILSEADRKRVFTVNGLIRATILIDGFVAGLWTMSVSTDKAEVTITPFKTVSAGERDHLANEAENLLACFAASATDRSVQVR